MERSFARTAILESSYFLGCWAWVYSGSILYFFSTIIISTVYAGVFYFFIFNRTRQGLHDLVVGTYVIRKSEREEFSGGVVARFHYIIFAAITITAVVVQIVLMSSMLPMSRELAKIEDIWFPEVNTGQFYQSPVDVGNFITIVTAVKDPEMPTEKLVDEIALIVLAEYPSVYKFDQLVIVIVHGWDIGVTEVWDFDTIAKTPEEWRKHLGLDRELGLKWPGS